MPITSDKGLCGGINTTVVKYTKMVDNIASDAGSVTSLLVVGEKGRAQLARGVFQQKVSQCVVDTAKSKDGISFVMASLVADSVLKEGYEKLQVIYNRFQSVISQIPTEMRLIPAPLPAEGSASAGGAIYEYEAGDPDEPDQEVILAKLLPQNLAIQIYRALLENSAGFYGAQMNAMDNATRNAGDMMNRYTLEYNRSRQAQITKELIEIISGAEAV